MSLHPTPSASNLTADRLSQRIAEGENPQDLLGEIVSYAQANPLPRLGLLKSINLLVENGAHVATGQKGCAFEVLIRDPDTDFSLTFSKIINDLLESPAEIPLHMLAGYSPTRLLVHLSLTMNVLEKVREGIHKRDDSGRTLSHWLWIPDGILAQQAALARAARRDPFPADITKTTWHVMLQAAWKTQALLIDYGVDMDVPDKDGITPMDMCRARINAKDAIFLRSQEICSRVEACMAAKQMEADTPPAPIMHGGLRF